MLNLCDQLETIMNSAWGNILPIREIPDHMDSYWYDWNVHTMKEKKIQTDLECHEGEKMLANI